MAVGSELVWKGKVRMRLSTKNESKLSRIQSEIIYVSPEIVTTLFAVSLYSQVRHKNLKRFSGTVFLWSTSNSSLFHPLHLDTRE